MTNQRALGLFVAGGLMLALYWATFIHPFFLTPDGTMGHDHRGSLVDATVGFVHFQKDPWSMPWFTPASCAGNMFVAGAAVPYLNVQQWLTFFINPLTASKINIIFFAGLGFLGTYLLCRRRFSTDTIAAFLGASLFLFNGFFAYRMVIGHTAFHGYMLIPLIGYLLIPGSDRDPRKVVRNILVAGILIAYLILTASAFMLLTTGLCLAGILAIHTLAKSATRQPGTIELKPYLPLAAAVFVAILLSLFKITLMLSTASNFEREFYPLPGLHNFMDALTLPIRLLFFSTPDWETETGFLFTNYRWPIDRHELEMGVGAPALALLVFALVTARGRIMDAVKAHRLASGVLLTVLVTPIVLNFYQPAWNELLKSLPIVRSFSVNVRLYAVYIPLVVLAVVLAFSMVRQYRLPIAIAVLAGTVATHWLVDRSYYSQQAYNPKVLTEFYDRFRHAPEKIPPISTTSELKFANFEGEALIIQNEMFAFGSSNIDCHNDIFGYQLEAFPKRELLVPNASVFKETDGQLNFKNPACYVFPEANGCAPGDHFRSDQIEVLDDFVNYRGLAFNSPRYQMISNATSFVSLLLAILGIILLSLKTKKNQK